jgi:peptide/nickel transport system permease protein
VSAIFGTLMGFAAAHWRGLADDIVMAATDAQASLPFFMVALVLIAVFGSSILLFVFLLGLYGWERYAKLARAMAMSASAQGYAEALRGLGAGPVRIYGLHILPNILSGLIVNATLNFPEIILLESSLSFLGLGIQPPMTSLGTMLGLGRGYLVSAWWIAVFPAIVIFLSTLCIGIGGDWLRDRLDPLQRRA